MEYLAGLSVVTLILILLAYFLPSVIALLRGKSNTFAIMILNIFLGWTFVGWVVALVWSFTADNKSQSIVINNSANNQEHPTNPSHQNQITLKSLNAPKALVIQTHRNHINRLKEIKNLLDKGVLTKEEFSHQKSQILAK